MSIFSAYLSIQNILKHSSFCDEPFFKPTEEKDILILILAHKKCASLFSPALRTLLIYPSPEILSRWAERDTCHTSMLAVGYSK